MIGQLVEYHNPAPGERYGIYKGKRDDGKSRIVTGWYGLSGGMGTERISDESVYQALTADKIYKRRKSIEEHFERIWTTNNARAATTKTVYFANSLPDGVIEGEIKHLPRVVAGELEDFFLAEGWFAYVK